MTMPNCAVAICNNCNQTTKGTDIKYFRFPRNKDLAKQWIIACGRSDQINLKNATICSTHFDSSCFETPLIQRMLQYTPKNNRNLKCDAVPTENISKVVEPCKKRKLEESIVMLDKKRRLEANQIVNELLTNTIKLEEPDDDSNVDISLDTECLPKLQAAQETCVNLQEVVKLRENIRMLEMENKKLLEKIDKQNKNIHQLESALTKLFTPGQIRTFKIRIEHTN